MKNAIEGLIRFKLNNEKEVSQIIHTASTLCLNDSLTFDENRNLLGFNNGVYDITQGLFRPYLLRF